LAADNSTKVTVTSLQYDTLSFLGAWDSRESKRPFLNSWELKNPSRNDNPTQAPAIR